MNVNKIYVFSNNNNQIYFKYQSQSFNIKSGFKIFITKFFKIIKSGSNDFNFNVQIKDKFSKKNHL